MFLGQMLASLRNNEPFRMTSGQQLREYHHFDDDAHAIRQIAESTAIGISDLSHGKPTSLCAIAKAVFSATGKNHLLEIGSLPDPVSENYGKIFERSSGLEGVKFRDAILGTAEYMKRCCSSLDIRSGRGSCHDR
jgi:nucleoside-diphosphate-sugar epimerase